MIELLRLMLYRCWLICNIVWREDKSQNMICRHSWVYTHWFFCFLSHLCRWLKKKINGTCILLAVNVNINPHQQLYNPAMISLKLKQIIRFVNRVEDWWCHPCRQFICKVSHIGCASQDWNNTRRDQKIKKKTTKNPTPTREYLQISPQPCKPCAVRRQRACSSRHSALHAAWARAVPCCAWAVRKTLGASQDNSIRMVYRSVMSLMQCLFIQNTLKGHLS